MTKPYIFQTKALEKIEHFQGRALVGMEPGLGKTFVSLLWASLRPEETKPIVVLCPKSVKYTWELEAKKHFNMRVEVLEGRKIPKGRMLYTHKVLVLNYDILSAWMDYLTKMNPQLVIIDECQALGDHTTIRTKTVTKLCQGVPYILALSGTPLLNRPIELWPVLNILCPKIFHSRWSFAHKFCSPKRYFWGWDFRGASNLNELHNQLIESCLIRYRKEDVLDDLPPKIRQVVPLPIRNPKEYNMAVADFLRWLRNYDPKRVQKARKAERLVKMGYLKRLAARLKIHSVMEWVDEFLSDGNEKLLLFVIHRGAVKALAKHYGNRAVVVDGSITGRGRQLHFDRFHHDSKVRLLIGNIKAAGVGWSCSATSTVAFAELGWTPGEHVQAEDRPHGISRGVKGQRVRAIYLVGKGTIEEKLCSLLQDKQEILNSVLDNGDGKGSLDIYDQLELALLEEAKPIMPKKKRSKK